MTTNPEAARILCFGDSNTWGQKAHEAGRYPLHVRWTGRLQMLLGDSFEIIEEGLNGRSTDLTYPERPGRNGRNYLLPCLLSQNPLDAVVIMLGTNDIKIEFGRDAQAVAHALETLVGDVIQTAKNELGSSPDVILVSPVHLEPDAPGFREIYATKYYNEQSVQASRELAPAIKKVADTHHCYFVDAAEVAAAGGDGVHMDEEGHHALAALLAEKLKEWSA